MRGRLYTVNVNVKSSVRTGPTSSKNTSALLRNVQKHEDLYGRKTIVSVA